MTSDDDAEGWYVDPYGLHGQRWFSGGRPSRLVRDGHVEANDPPPDRPFDGRLVRATGGAEPSAGGDDLRRADENQGGAYDPRTAIDAVLDGSTWFPIN